ncbi:MAG: RHS repeat-associated core domain-containing protein [Kiritimatiellia bacterium]
MGLLQSMHHWMFAGACLLAGVPLLFCLGAWAGTSPGLRRLFRALGDRFRSLAPSVRAALSALLVVATLHGVPKVPPGGNAPSSGPPPAGMVSGGLPARPARGPSSGPRLTAGQYRAGFALARVATNPSPALASVPSNAVVHAPWTRYGVAEDTFWLPATNWSFTLGTNRVGGLHVSSSGTLSFGWPKGSPRARRMPDGSGLDFLAPLQTSLGIVPPAGRFWHAPTASNSLLLAWQDVFAGRDAGLPVTFQAELFPSGDFVYRYDLSRLSATNALPATNWVVGAQHGGGGETFAFGGTGVLVHGLELHWRAFGMLDPDIADHDGDGLSTCDEVMVHGTDPRLPDTDLDGVLDGAEVAAGTSPLLRDTDGDGLVDGSDPDPLSPTPPDDLDGDGIPDACETAKFGGTNAVDSLAYDPYDTGFPLSTKIAAGMDPFAEASAPTNLAWNLASLKLFDAFRCDLPADGTNRVYERTFTIDRKGGWQQYFLSASSNAPAGWSLDGMALEWADSEGGSGTATASPPDDSLWLPVSTNALQLTLALRATSTNSTCPQPLYLLAWAPGVLVDGAGAAAEINGARCQAVEWTGGGTSVGVRYDFSNRPCRAAPSEMEQAALLDPFPGEARLVFTPDGGFTGGSLAAKAPGIYDVPGCTIAPAPPPARRGARGAGGRGDPGEGPVERLLFFEPRIAYGDGRHGGCGTTLFFDAATGDYEPASDYPLDSRCLREGWRQDATGGHPCDCRAEIGYGDPALAAYFDETVEDDGLRATGTIFFDGRPVWSGEAIHRVGERCHDPFYDECGDCASGCADGDCDGLEGDGLGSLAFRIPLGIPRDGQVSGFLWFRATEPLLVAPSTFNLLARDDAAVAESAAGGTRTIACSDARGRTVVVEPIAHGVRITVRKTAGDELEHVWEIANVGGSPRQVAFKKISRRDNVMRDVVYSYRGDGEWACFDNISQLSEQVLRTDTLDDGPHGVLREERIVRDAAGAILSRDVAESRRFGCGQDATLRQTYHATLGLEPDGEPGLVEDHATCWEDDAHPRRNGRPRLVWGESRPWSYQAWDDEGREILRLDQFDGSEVPWLLSNWAAPSDLSDLSDHPGLAAIATVSDYAPLPGDDNPLAALDSVRTESRHLVRDGAAACIGRTWHVHTVGTDTVDRAFATVKTIRACSPTAAFDDPGNAVSTATRFDADAPGIPLLLRGRTLESTDEDGVTTTYDCVLGDYDPATRTFTPGGAETALRTIAQRWYQSNPSDTSDLTIQDAAHGTTLYSATLLHATGATLDWQAHTYDDRNRLRSTLYSDGSISTNAYSCCRLLWTQDRNGFKTLRSAETGKDHLYYATEEESLAQLPGYGYGHRTTMHFMDALGRETNTVVTAVGEPGSAATPGCGTLGFTASETTAYPHGIGDHAVHVDRRGVRTVTTRTSHADREESVTLTFSPANPDVCVVASTNIAYRNGRSIAIRSWDGGWTRETSWIDYAADGTRRTFSVTEASDSSGAITNQIAHGDFLGRTVATLRPGTAGAWLVTSNAYDGATSRLVRSETTGQPATTYLYDERGEMAATVQSGVKTASETRYENIGGAWWRVDVRSTSREGVTNAVATTRRQLTGLSNALRSRTVNTGPNGSTTTESGSYNPQTCELTTVRATDAATPSTTVSKFGRSIRRETLRETVYNYFDPLGRVAYSETRDPETGVYSHFRWSGLDESDNETHYGIYYYDDDLHVTGSRTFDAFGRETSRTDALGNTVTNTYDALGRPVAATGATYPVAYGYDAAGRTTALATARGNAAGFAALAVQLAGGASLASLASPASLDLTAWNYDHATGLATNKVYADGSAVSYAYTPDGKPLRTAWARGAWKENAYNPDGLLTGVSYSDATPAAALGYDAFQRPAFASNAVARYAYQNSHLGTATNETAMVGGDTATLARTLDNRHRLAELRVEDAPPVQYGYDSENRHSAVSNTAFRATYAYTSDGWDAGYSVNLTNGVVLARNLTRDPYRRSLVKAITNSVSGVPYNPLAYTYDLLNRVTSRNTDTFDYNARSEVTAAIIQPAHTNRYAFDNIGNALWASLNSVTNIYTANELNQYFLISNHVNHVNPVQISPVYDLDGNMTWDGRFNYTYDAENRLVAAYSNGLCVVFNAYDHLSRRVLKISRGGAETRGFVYDGWLPVLEIVATASGVTTNHYVWGKDLSGTLQGAGGVGGLLAVQMGGTWYFPFYDNNGNIIAYADESGAIVAEYTYDAFGRTIAATGSLADAFRHRFSTKYYDAEIGLYYYGYRFCAPELMRWLSRDPIGERGGANVYAFTANSPLERVDPLGLKWIVRREGASQADADCKCDNVEALAVKIGLDVNDYQKWLSPADGYALPSSTTKLMPDRKFRIPNTVYAYWAGALGGVGKSSVHWDGSINYLSGLGFKVIPYEHSVGNYWVLNSILPNAANSRALHGLYFWGHGNTDALGSHYGNFNGGSQDPVLSYGSLHLPYKMALGLMFACYSDSGKPTLFSNAPGAIWHGYTGILVPIPLLNSYHVSNFISAGSQETNP